MENIFVEFLPPWVETGMQPAFYDKESGTCLQQTARMYDRVNMLIRMFNKLSKETRDNFTELYNYVHDYFDNLDVQEEVDHKLDEMVEDGTLENMILPYVDEFLAGYAYNVKVVIPGTFGITANSGDIQLIKAYDKNVVIDTHTSTFKDEVENFLTRNDSGHIDYLILTHYHNDHIGNVINLIDDGFVDQNTIVYLPGYSTLIESNPTILADYTAIINKLDAEDIPVVNPTEGMKLSIQDVDFTFYNCEQTIFTNYNYTDYNDCSTVVLLEYGDKKTLFTADITTKPFQRFESQDMFDFKIDIYKIEHHANNYNADPLPFVNRITPDYYFQTSDLGNMYDGAGLQSAVGSFLKDKPSKLYSMYNNEDDIVFDISKNNIKVIGKENYSTSNRPVEFHIYVDASTVNTKRDGSSTYPYKYLSEAYGRINSSEYERYKIHLADGNYMSESASSTVQGKTTGSTTVSVVGNSADKTKVKVYNSTHAYNNVNLDFQYITFTGEVAYVDHAYLTMDNCDATKSDSAISAFITGQQSKLRIRRCSFTNATSAINVNNADIFVSYTTFTDCTNAITSAWSSRIQRTNNTYSNVTKEVNLSSGAIDKSQSDPLFKVLTAEADHTIGSSYTFVESVRNYNCLLLYFGYTDYNTTAVIIDQGFATFANDKNYNAYITVPTDGGGGPTQFMCTIKFTNNTGWTLVAGSNSYRLRTIVGCKLQNGINI